MSFINSHAAPANNKTVVLGNVAAERFAASLHGKTEDLGLYVYMYYH